MATEFELDGRLSVVHPVYRTGGFDLEIDGRRVVAKLERREDGACLLEIDGVAHPVWIAGHGAEIFLHYAGRSHRVEAINSLERAAREAEAASGGDAITAPMPGVVVEVAVTPGDHVARGGLLMTIESMKLQTAIHALHDGVVDEVGVAAGQSFDKGAVLVRMSIGDEETEGSHS